MAKYRVYNFTGVNQKTSPILHKDGELLACQNLDSIPTGAKTKRSGYQTFLGTLPGDINELYVWDYPANSNIFYYAQAGSVLHVCVDPAGTVWDIAGGGTQTNSAKMSFAAIGTYLLTSHVSGTTRHSTDGTSFTDTTLAPAAGYLTAYKQRIYAGYGTQFTASELGSPSGWSTGATNPSFSEPVEGGGVVNAIFTANDEVIITQTSGDIFHFDGYRKYASPSNDAPGDMSSVGRTDGLQFYVNPEGAWAFNTKPNKISDPIQPMFFNNSGSAASYLSFESAAKGEAVKDQYYCYVGTITSDIYPKTITDCVIKYDLSLNEWSWYQIPEPMYSIYYDHTNTYGLLWGGSNQVYRFVEGATSDNGSPIEAYMLGFLHFKEPERDKLIKRISALASPGCGATFSIAMSDNLDINNLEWHDIGDLFNGFRKFIAPEGLRGKFMFYQLHERSTDKPFTFYGFTVEFDYVGE